MPGQPIAVAPGQAFAGQAVAGQPGRPMPGQQFPPVQQMPGHGGFPSGPGVVGQQGGPFPPHGQFAPGFAQVPPGYGGQPAVRKNRGLTIALAVGAGLFGIVATIWSLRDQSPGSSSMDSIAAGDCVKVRSAGDQVAASKVDCSASLLKVGVRIDGSSTPCPAGDYDQLMIDGSPGYRLCLVPNVVQGDCLTDIRSTSASYQRIACTDPKKELEIVSLVPGQTAKGVCQGKGSNGALSYSEPALVICVKS